MIQKIVKLEPKHILKDAYWNKSTIYGSQISYQMPSGHVISAVRSYPGETTKDVEDRLVKMVMDYISRGKE